MFAVQQNLIQGGVYNDMHGLEPSNVPMSHTRVVWDRNIVLVLVLMHLTVS